MIPNRSPRFLLAACALASLAPRAFTPVGDSPARGTAHGACSSAEAQAEHALRLAAGSRVDLTPAHRDLLTQVLSQADAGPDLLRTALRGLLPERCEPILAWAHQLALADEGLQGVFIEVLSDQVPVQWIWDFYQAQPDSQEAAAGRRLLVLALGDGGHLLRAAREDPDAGVRAAAWLTLCARSSCDLPGWVCGETDPRTLVPRIWALLIPGLLVLACPAAAGVESG